MARYRRSVRHAVPRNCDVLAEKRPSYRNSKLSNRPQWTTGRPVGRTCFSGRCEAGNPSVTQRCALPPCGYIARHSLPPTRNHPSAAAASSPARRRRRRTLLGDIQLRRRQMESCSLPASTQSYTEATFAGDGACVCDDVTATASAPPLVCGVFASRWSSSCA